MSFTFTRTALAMTIAATTGTAFADTLSLQEETVVTATRTAQTLDKTLAPVEVMTAEDIARLQVRDMGDLLSRMTSVNIKSSGGRGSTTSMFVRGNNSDHTLVLIDGIRVGSASNGSASLQHIDPATIERVELVRGPRSSIYGSEAIGGVLQIFTRKGAEVSQGSIKVGGGSNNSWNSSVGGTYRADDYWVNAQLAHDETEGFNRTDSDTYPDNDDDAYRNSTLGLSGGYDFSQAVGLTANYQKSEGESEYDSCYEGWFSIDCMPYSEFERETLSGKLKTQWSKEFVTYWTAGRSEDSSEVFDDLTPDESRYGGNRNFFDTTRISYGMQNDYAFSPENILTIGADYYDDKLDSNAPIATAGSILERDNLGIYGQYQLSLGNNSFVAGVRSDDNEQYGEQTTGNLAYGYQLTDSTKVVASWGTAFKAPTFNELYWPGYGNPELKPEESENYELGFKYNLNSVSAEVSAFRNKVDQLIGFGPNYIPENIDEALIKGVELNASAQLLSWDVSANYTWLDPKDQETEKVLSYRAENSAAINADNRWGDFSLGFTVRGQDSVYTNGSNTSELDGFGLLDIRAAYQATENVQLQLKVDNVLDKDYQLTSGYRQDGTNGMLSMTYSM